MRKSNIKISAPVSVNPNACDGCGLCAETCPSQVLEMREITDEEKQDLHFFGKLKIRIKGNTKSFVSDADACIACGKCVKSCHENAITVRDYKKRA